VEEDLGFDNFKNSPTYKSWDSSWCWEGPSREFRVLFVCSCQRKDDSGDNFNLSFTYFMPFECHDNSVIREEKRPPPVG
jgi:hypothetical protein